MAAEERSDKIEGLLEQAVDATRRTHLANERNQLAWWRTGLAAFAVAIGVGRVAPDLNRTATTWPYIVAGVGFALWGLLAIGYGSFHQAAVERALEEGRFVRSRGWPVAVLAVGGLGLGLLTALLILLD